MASKNGASINYCHQSRSEEKTNPRSLKSKNVIFHNRILLPIPSYGLNNKVYLALQPGQDKDRCEFKTMQQEMENSWQFKEETTLWITLLSRDRLKRSRNGTIHVTHQSHSGNPCTTTIKAFMCLGQDSQAEPISLQTGFEFIVFLLLNWLSP